MRQIERKPGSWVVWVRHGCWHGRRFALPRAARAFRAGLTKDGVTWAGVIDVY